MNRWLSLLGCVVLGVALLVCGLLVPAHLRAVNGSLLERAGANTPGLIEHGLALVDAKNLGAARSLLKSAQQEAIPGGDKLASAVAHLAEVSPGLDRWGSPEPLLLAPAPDQETRTGEPKPAQAVSQPLTELLVHLENREKALDFLRASPQPGVQELLRFRANTNTVLFSPSPSAAGQALDAALSICGLLFEQGRLSAGLSNSVSGLVAQANRGGDSQPFEQVLMDFMSLGQRFNWGQLTVFVARIDDAETLRLLANLVRNANSPALFSAVELSGQPSAVAGYLMRFNQTGLGDLGSSLRFGAGGVNELLRRNQRLSASDFHPRLGVELCLRAPWLALAVKWLLYLSSGVLLAAGMHFARPAASVLERPLQVRGFHVAREVLFSLGFLLVVLLLSEPFLAQDSQKVEFPFRLHLPTAGNGVPAGTASVPPSTSIMSQSNLLTLLLFFALQGLLYTASLLKLAEIRRQKVLVPIKLKLLENEDHLFDAGLYLGFLGTIVSFIIFSLGVVKEFSLMVAYSSTSFGIIFVSLFKILHLRPARRKMLLEANAGSSEPTSTPAPRTIAVHL